MNLDEELEALRPYITEVAKLAKSYLAALWWRDSTGNLRNGTISFISTGKEVLGVTAGHVADAVIAHSHTPQGFNIQIGSARFENPSARLIDIKRHPDLATFKLSDVFVTTAGRNIATSRVWPPQRPVPGDLVMFAGHPGQNKQDRVREVEFDFAWFVGKLDSASEDNIGMVLKIRESMSLPGARRTEPESDLGGCSGGLVLRVAESPIVTLEPVGIIHTYSPTLELLYAHPLCRIDEHGRIE
jgi:hypothetical protein